MEEKSYYKDVFTLGPSFKTNLEIFLTSNSISYKPESKKKKQEIYLDDVIGVKVINSRGSEDESVFIHIYSYPLKKRTFSKVARRQRVEYVFGVSGEKSAGENLALADKWVRCIRWLQAKNSDLDLAAIHTDDPPKQQFLIFINPFGGQGRAMKMFEKNVKPMLEEAHVQYELKVTEHNGHAKEIIEDMEILKNFDCIVCCSGDGIINEVINGMMCRPDWQETIKIPVGHIPCGSGNGLCAASLYYSGEPFDMISSVFSVVTGDEVPLDVVKAESVKGPHYAFLSVVFGIVADVDIESEKYRYMGETRFTVMAVKKIIQKQSISGKMWYLPANNDSCSANGILENGACNSQFESTSHLPRGNGITGQPKAKEVINEQNLEEGKLDHTSMTNGHLGDSKLSDDLLNKPKSDLPPGNEIVEGDDDVAVKGKDANLENVNLKDGKLDDVILNDGNLDKSCAANGRLCGAPNRFLPEFNEAIPDSWEVIEGNFLGWLFVSVSHIGRDVFVAPEATFGDGVIHCICLNGDMSRSDLISVVTKLDSGEHVNVRGVNSIKARAFRLEPTSAVSKIITIDGERAELGKLQGEVFRGLARVKCRRPKIEQKKDL